MLLTKRRPQCIVRAPQRINRARLSSATALRHSGCNLTTGTALIVEYVHFLFPTHFPLWLLTAWTKRKIISELSKCVFGLFGLPSDKHDRCSILGSDALPVRHMHACTSTAITSCDQTRRCLEYSLPHLQLPHVPLSLWLSYCDSFLSSLLERFDSFWYKGYLCWVLAAALCNR